MNSHAYDNRAIAARFLPQGLAGALPESLCAKLARTHYENFTVGSMFLPRALRKHVFNIYAYCRVCDDLADETGDPELSLRLLDWWREELFACFAGNPVHPVFQALSETIEAFDLPIQPFEDLISAFMQDQKITRYRTFKELLDYCSRSANPVGRLFLCLLGYRDAERQRLSDYTCTALQLANFWQDIGNDYPRGRIYIPLEDMEKFGYSECELRNQIVNTCFRRLMRFQINRTREFFERGAGLSRLIDGVGSVDIELFTRGGMCLLESIERQNYNVFSKRITVSTSKKIALMLGWGLKHLYSRKRAGD